MLSWVGARCWTRIKAMPTSAGSASMSLRQASRPPAEAPIPTTGKSANLAVCLRGAPAGSRPDHFGLARTGAWHSAVLKGRRPTAIQPIERDEDRAWWQAPTQLSPKLSTRTRRVLYNIAHSQSRNAIVWLRVQRDLIASYPCRPGVLPVVVTGRSSAVASLARLPWRPAHEWCRPALAFDGLLRAIGRST